MSYTKLDAYIERTEQIEEAVRTGDVEQLFAISDSFAEQDDMENATYFRRLAYSIERSEWAYDESIGN